MYAGITWVLVSSGTQVQPQKILDPDYLSDYPFVSYDYARKEYIVQEAMGRKLLFGIIFLVLPKP